MLTLARKAISRLDSFVELARERRRIGHLYSPDPANLNSEQHLTAAIDWIKRAQDAGSNRGVSYGVYFGSDFQESYPETTGYICRTFVDLAWDGRPDLLERAVQMGQWEADIQMPQGAVMGGIFNSNPSPAIFNTGMVMLGWNALIRAGQSDRFKSACKRAAEWLVEMQETDGNWIRGNSAYARGTSTVYNVKAAWGLCEAGYLLDQPRYIEAAIRNAEFCLSRQQSNGWFRDCCLTDPEQPLLHTLAYTMQGLIEIGKLTGRRDFIQAAQRTADAQIRIMHEDGFIPGRQDSSFASAASWCCLTGSAQTSIVLSELYLITRESKYRDAVKKINGFLMARHDIQNSDPRLRGGLPGSWPTWGDYGRLKILNWATKYLIDALCMEKKIQ